MKKFENKQENLISFITIVLIMGGFVCMNHWGKERQKHSNYAPGKSLSRTESAAVDALQDSTLVQRINTYNAMLYDYHQMLARSHMRKKDKFNAFELNRAGLPKLFNDNDTLRQYDDNLRKYERDSIEARYQQLHRQLAHKRQKQK